MKFSLQCNIRHLTEGSKFTGTFNYDSTPFDCRSTSNRKRMAVKRRSSSFLACNSRLCTVAPYVDHMLHRDRSWSKSIASGSVRLWDLRSCCVVLSHVMRRRPRGLLHAVLWWESWQDSDRRLRYRPMRMGVERRQILVESNAFTDIAYCNRLEVVSYLAMY